MTEKYVMVSLDEERAKKLADVLSSATSRKILQYLSEKEATAMEISKALNIQLNTLNYNLKNLISANLIESKEFRWSPKGREMDIYKLKRKYIIIAPEKTSEIRETLKKILPVGLMGLVIASIIQFTNKLKIVSLDTIQTITRTGIESSKSLAVEESAKAFAAPQASALGSAAQQELINKTTENIPKVVEYTTNNGLYFLIGVLFAIILYLILTWRSSK